MTLRRTGILLVLIAALASAVLAQGTGSTTAQSDKQFQAALQKEMVAGDLKGAIEEYRKIVGATECRSRSRRAGAPADGGVLPEAGSAEAQKIYEKIISEFAAQKDAVSQARGRLAALKPAESAGFMSAPIDTRLGVDWVPSPDGRLVVENSQTDLILHDTVGEARILVKREGQAGRVAEVHTWSPDSRRIAYKWRMDAANSIEVHIVDVQTGTTQTVGGQMAPEASPRRGQIRAWTTKGETCGRPASAT